METQIKIFCSKNWSDYELLDTGGGEKLERFGPYTFVRPYESAFWKKTLGDKEWDKAVGKFWSSKEGAKNGWKMRNKTEPKWIMSYKGIKFFASPTQFRHLSFFPEQASHWDFIENSLGKASRVLGNKPIKFLNLFGYTGVASLVALHAGAEVTHVDASKQVLKWVKDNQKISSLDKMPLRIICDDVLKFLEREIKKGNKYNCLMMDPPKFGRGPKGEIWKIEKDLPILLDKARKVLSDKPLFVILTSYATHFSSLSLGYALEEMMRDFKSVRNVTDREELKQDPLRVGLADFGELCLIEKSNDRAIPLANTAIWNTL